MKAILIAAGSSTRLRPLTNDCPKSMLPFRGKPLIYWAVDQFREAGIQDISVIRGYLKSKIILKDVTFFENSDYVNNNILFSLLYARPKLEDCIKQNASVIVAYSDLWFDRLVLNQILEAPQDIALLVENNWIRAYDERTDNPPSTAEKTIISAEGIALEIGKNVPVSTDSTTGNHVSEFIGIWKMSPKGIQSFLSIFDKIFARLRPTDPLHSAKEFKKAYVTDLFQEMIECGVKIHCIPNQGQWLEFDTVQDYKLHEQEK